jgi:hypothetical protein
LSPWHGTSSGHVFQISRVAANILSKKLRIADKEWSSGWGVAFLAIMKKNSLL